jgi:hypothetical protein
MIARGSPSLVRLDHRGGLRIRLAEVGYRAVRVEIKRHTDRISRALVEIHGIHVLTLHG